MYIWLRWNFRKKVRRELYSIYRVLFREKQIWNVICHFTRRLNSDILIKNYKLEKKGTHDGLIVYNKINKMHLENRLNFQFMLTVMNAYIKIKSELFSKQRVMLRKWCQIHTYPFFGIIVVVGYLILSEYKQPFFEV